METLLKAENDKQRRKRRIAKRGGLLAAYLLFCLWWNHRNNFDVDVPTPTLPSPNAFALYQAAGQKLKSERSIAYALEPNAFREHDGVAARVNQWQLPGTRGSAWIKAKEDHPYSQGEREQLVAENASVLHLLHLGLLLPYRQPPQRRIAYDTTIYRKSLPLAQLLALESRNRGERGDWNGAACAALDILAMSTQQMIGAPVYGRSVAIACARPGAEALQQAIPHLSTTQAQGALRRLEAIEAAQVPFAETLQEEKWYGLAGRAALLRLSPQPFWAELQRLGVREYNGLEGYKALTTEYWQRLPRNAHSWLFGRRYALDAYERYMNVRIAAARHPYDTHPPILDVPNDPLNEALLGVRHGLKLSRGDGERIALDARPAAQRHMLQIALALQAYHQTWGRYPETLDNLVPHFLAHLPTDSFAATDTFRYQRIGTHFRLESAILPESE